MHVLVLRYRHFYTAKNKVNKKILSGIIKFISIVENGNSGMFRIILKLVLQERGLYQNKLFIEMQLSNHFVVPGHICTRLEIHLISNGNFFQKGFYDGNS